MKGDSMDKERMEFIRDEVLKRFLNYVKQDTTAVEESAKTPSSPGQLILADQLARELKELGLMNAECDENGYVYATLPASENVQSPPVTFCAHMDTSPSEPGNDVKPVLHKDYQGGPISFPDNPELMLTPSESPPLSTYKGDTVITASGKTLLGADDKAGIAEIMAALAYFMRYKDAFHPELRIVFTPDEEIGRGTDKITLEKLGRYGYTLDGSMAGEIEDECFDAWKAEFEFMGRNVHPGFAKGKMLNAAEIAARFISQIPEQETPAHTEKREGFYHLSGLRGDENRTCFSLIMRDFDVEKNQRRLEYLEALNSAFEERYPGLKIRMKTTHQYQNMRRILDQYPQVTALAEQAVKNIGLTPLKAAIRGGTDGARLCYKGVPTPNLFAGGHLFHSKKEWVALTAMTQAVLVVIELSRLWAQSELSE
jgi:tripeptide aminopeptidase